MLFYSLLSPDKPMYIRAVMLVLREHVNVSALKQAWTLTVKRHGSLRSSLRWEGLSEPLVEVHANIDLPFEELDWQTLNPNDYDDRLREYIWAEKLIGFDL